MASAKYNLDPYGEWAAGEGVPIAEAAAVDLVAQEVGPWARYDARGAIIHCTGRGDFCNMMLLEIPAGKATAPQRHLFEALCFVLEGTGSTQIDLGDGRTRSFEWGPRSFFSVPLNATYRYFNASGLRPARIASTTNLPIIMNTFHSEAFVFGTPHVFLDRFGEDKYYEGEGDLTLVSQGNNIWETNFVPDMGSLPLTDYSDRGPGSSNIKFILGDGVMYAHMSEVASASYKKAHRHMDGVHVLTLSGGGYSLLWYEGDRDYTRIDWKYGTVFPPLDKQFHQHFVTSNEPSRYVATTYGGIRYPIFERTRRIAIAKEGVRQESSRSVKDGGAQIEYEDQDPRIHALWLEELRKNQVEPTEAFRDGPPRAKR